MTTISDEALTEAEERFNAIRTTSRSPRKRKVYPRITKRPDLAGTFGYDSKGNYIGKPWSKCW